MCSASVLSPGSGRRIPESRSGQARPASTGGFSETDLLYNLRREARGTSFGRTRSGRERKKEGKSNKLLKKIKTP
jgi:hypothetical protein